MNFLLFALCIFALDQGTKWWVSETLPIFGTAGMDFPYGGVPLFQNFFGIEGSIVFAQNRGAAWGLLGEYPILLLSLRLFLIGFLLYSFFRHQSKFRRFALALILAGALGNIFDTMIRGQVVDFLYFVLFGYPYPVFNVADIAITGGVILLFFQPKEATAPSRSL